MDELKLRNQRCAFVAVERGEKPVCVEAVGQFDHAARASGAITGQMGHGHPRYKWAHDVAADLAQSTSCSFKWIGG